MRLRRQRMWSMVVLLCSLLVSAAGWAGSMGDEIAIHKSMSADQVVGNMLARNAEREKSLQSYEGFRHYRVEYKGFPSSRSAEMEVAVKFTAPDKKEFRIVSERGSSVLINKVLKKLLEAEQEAAEQSARLQSTLSPANYSFELVGEDRLDGRTQYMLLVEPRRKDKLLYHGIIWVDTEDFAVSRIEAEPARNPSFWIKKTQIVHHYIKVGPFWLPGGNQSESSTRFGGHAFLNIEYSGYVLGHSAQRTRELGFACIFKDGLS